MTGYDIKDVECLAASKNGKNLLMQNHNCTEFRGIDNGEDGKCWIPQSQITDDSEVFDVGGAGTLIITEWLANERGWL